MGRGVSLYSLDPHSPVVERSWLGSVVVGRRASDRKITGSTAGALLGSLGQKARVA